MSELSTKQRNNLKNSVFGIPSLRKYPLNDKEHVLKAIQFFHHCPLEHKKELAHNINKEAKKYNISISQSSNIYEYLNESEQIEIDLMQDVFDLEEDLYLVEAFGMNEPEAKGSVDTAINLWKKRKTFVKTPKDKQRILSDLRAEKNAIDTMQRQADFNGILLRAKATAKNMSKKIASGDYDSIKKIRGKAEVNAGNNRRVGKVLAVGAASVAAGAAIGGAMGKRSANNKGNGSFGTKVKVGTGIAAGALAGNAVAMGTMGATFAKQRADMQKAKDPDKPLRQHAERYANFISSFQSEMMEYQPGQEEQQQGEGED